MVAELPLPDKAVGIYRGGVVPLVLSRGEMLHLPETMQRRKHAIRRAQKALSLQSCGSRRHTKTRLRIARRQHLVRHFGLVGITESITKADIDAQKRLFEKKMNIEDLQDPAKVQKLARQYAAIEGAN